MTNQESSLSTATEEVFIQYFKTEGILAEYPAKHYSEDTEAETPDIMIKAVVSKFVDNAFDPGQRLYKAEVEIKIRGNMAKVTVEGFDKAASLMEDMMDNIGNNAATILALPAIQFFSMFATIDEENANERDDDDKRRIRCRKIMLLVQEKP